MLNPVGLKSFIILIVLTCWCQFLHADYWTQKANYPGNGSSRAFCFSIGDKGYFGCGDNGVYANDFWQYDTTSNTWTQKASFGGTPRWSGVSFSVGGYGFAGLGWQLGLMMSDIWRYDPVADSWTQMNNFPPGQRQVPVSFVIGNKAYVGTGRNNSNVFQNDLWEYDYTLDAWTQKANVPGPVRSQPFGFAIDMLGYIGGGFDQMLNGLNDFHEYNPVTNMWTTRSSVPAPGRGDPAGFAIGCRGYTGTGQTLPVHSVLNELWQFNPTNNQWIAKSSFGGTPRDEASFFVIGEKGYIGLGGNNGGSLTDDFWEYTPDTTCLTSVPVALFSAPNQICPGTCASFTNLSTNATTYQWLFPGANPSSSTDTNPANICYYNPGNYDVTLIATGAGGSDTVTLSNYITVFPHPAPQGISQSGDTLFANPGAISYQWYYNGMLIPGATDYFHVATQNGNYNVVATDPNGCEVEAVIFDVVTHIAGAAYTGNYQLTFNPVSNEIIVSCNSVIAHSTVCIYSVKGKLVFCKSFHANSGTNRILLDGSDLSTGIYFAVVNSRQVTKCIRFFKP